jgi:ubiquinone/menaquinone biosynthesis C-methylase UbiE
MKSINHFDLIAPYYDRFIKPVDVTHFIAIIKLPTTGYLLDAGGGTGRKSLPLQEMTSGIVIADSSLGMLSQAQAKGSSLNICSETEHLPFKTESYARIIMVDALHHVANYRHTLQELWRILKPGGRLVIEEPDIRTLPVRVLAILEKLALMRSHFISPQTISEDLSNRGAKVVIQVDQAIAWIIADKPAP